MNATVLTIIGCSISFIATTLGACLIFAFKKEINEKVNCLINGIVAGITIAAAIFGMIIPSFDYAYYLNNLNFLPAIIGIIIGSLCLHFVDILVVNITKKHSYLQTNIQNKTKLTTFFIAFTFHNIPEGLAIGFAFGNALVLGTSSAFATAMALSIAISIQNIPEGLAVSMPVYNHTGNKTKGFWFGVLSGVVEPIFAVLGIVLATSVEILLPWLLAFSAGAMMFVASDELVPNSKHETSKIGTWGFIFGFVIMMLLDILLG